MDRRKSSSSSPSSMWNTDRLLQIAFILVMLINIVLLCTATSTTAWAVRDVGKIDRDDYIQIRFGLFQKCVWTKANDTEECMNTWQNAPGWRRASVGTITISIIFCVFSTIYTILYYFDVRPIKGQCRCPISNRPCTKASLPIVVGAVLGFFALLVMLVILGLGTAQFTYFNDYSMYLAVAALTLLFVCSSLGGGIVYLSGASPSDPAPVNV